MPSKKPNVPSVYKVDPTDTTKSKPVARERIPFVRIPTAHIVKTDGSVDADALSRVMTQLQDNIHDATVSHRSDPMNNFVIVQSVTLIKGTPYTIRHGLGSAFSYYHPVRNYATYVDSSGKTQNSEPFAAVETDGNKDANGVAQDVTQYLVLNPSASGQYDIKICA